MKERIKRKIRKGTALVLALTLGMNQFPLISQKAVEINAQEDKGNKPSVTAFATKDELMNTFNAYGRNSNVGKIVFGKDCNKTPLEWFVLGKDAGIEGDNIAIFVTDDIIRDEVFESEFEENKIFDPSFGEYSRNPSEVYPEHYGASKLRGLLKTIAKNTDYFTVAEQSLMQATPVKTRDTYNDTEYTTTDILYSLKEYQNFSRLVAGSMEDKEIEMYPHYNSGTWFWLRDPIEPEDYNRDVTSRDRAYAIVTGKGDARPYFGPEIVELRYAVRPASNLSLASVIFASAATAATSSAMKKGIIEKKKAMTLRLDGENKEIGSVICDNAQGMLLAKKSATAIGPVSLVVQGNDGSVDWYYSKIITDTDVIKVSDIKSRLQLASEVELSDCKIWIETTIDNVSYAKMSTGGIITSEDCLALKQNVNPSITAFATKDTLMNTFRQDGSNSTIGKIVFGKDSGKNPMEWYVLGKDDAVEGDNIAIFAADDLSLEKEFIFRPNEKRSYDVNFGVYSSNPSEVYASHYGASKARNILNELAKNTDYFTETEQSLMQTTSVTTKDKLNNTTYVTTDILYLLNNQRPDIYDDKRVVRAGSKDNIILPKRYYWDSGREFWLRSPNVYTALPGYYVCESRFYRATLRPASNLKLSTVLFASSAVAATIKGARSGVIEEGSAMTLRIDSRDEEIGSVICDSKQGILIVKKSANAEGTVSVVIQGNDGFGDWYYSRVIENKLEIKVSDIKKGLHLANDIVLSACKVWVETTVDGVSYAKMSSEGTISNDELTGLDIKQNLPNVTTFAMKDALMNAFLQDGTNRNIGKIVYGKNGEMNPLEWYVLGKDAGVKGDNIAIFAADNINEDVESYKDSYADLPDVYDFDTSFGTYSINPVSVAHNHYGASDLRVKLKELATNTDYFTEIEQSLMQATTVTTKDIFNNTEYTTTEVLYALDTEGYDEECNRLILYAGSRNDKMLPSKWYWNYGRDFSLRSPCIGGEFVFFAKSDIQYSDVCYNRGIRPASNLNVSSVLFASVALAAGADSAESGELPEGTAMTLRFDGSDMEIGSVIYDNTQEMVLAERAPSAKGIVSLVIQGNDGFKDWYYSKDIKDKIDIKASELKEGLDLVADVVLSDCKIWVETTVDGMCYANMATERRITSELLLGTDPTPPSVVSFATKDILMNQLQQDGTNSFIGKIVLGKDYYKNPMEWYVLGKDAGVKGDNIAIFAKNPMIIDEAFEANGSENKKFDESFGVYKSNPVEVYPNHYGASQLRKKLQECAKSTRFTVEEQSLMQATTVTTKDTLNNTEYTTTDVLYLLKESENNKILCAGSKNDKRLSMNTYWSEGKAFWLRSPGFENNYVFYALKGGRNTINIDDMHCRTKDINICVASNLNLSSVLFTSAATAATYDVVKVRKIEEGKAMSLRLDGNNKEIGSVICDTTQGILLAKKSVSAKGRVSLVIQGRDKISNCDWYYSKVILGEELIKASDIRDWLQLVSEVEFSDCKIWLETTIDGMHYARLATEKTITSEDFSNLDKNYSTVTSFVTKNELMNNYHPSGEQPSVEKIAYGKDSEKNPLEWYVLGKDAGVKGDNIAIFASNAIVVEQVFEDDVSGNKPFNTSFGVYDTNPSTVLPTHYGASDLRAILKKMAKDKDYFTAAEQSFMQATTVTTIDGATWDGIAYATTDILYALSGDYDQNGILFAGSKDHKVLPMQIYANSGKAFWLRTPNLIVENCGNCANPPNAIGGCLIDGKCAVRPATNLKMSSVLFASAAIAATSDTVEKGEIAKDATLLLRMDGRNKEIGSVTCDNVHGKLLVKKSNSAVGRVALVVLGDNGFGDWFYSKTITDEETIETADIRKALGLATDVELADCKVWLEIDIDGISYAKMAKGQELPDESTTEQDSFEEITTEAEQETEPESTDKEETTAKPKKERITKVVLLANTYIYNGTAKQPSVTVKAGTKKLVIGKDYKVTYKNNINPGTASVIIVGTGNYTGNITKTFKINLSKVANLKQNTSYATNKITMNWNTVKGADGYVIYRATTKNGSYKYCKSVKTNTAVHQGLKSGSKYYYKVRAYKKLNGKKVYGDYSNVKTMVTKPSTPKSFSILRKSKTAKITWVKSRGAQGYDIYMSSSRNGSYTRIKTVGASTTSYSKTGLVKGKKYYFKMRTYIKTGTGVKIYSGYSNIKLVTVK